MSLLEPDARVVVPPTDSVPAACVMAPAALTTRFLPPLKVRLPLNAVAPPLSVRLSLNTASRTSMAPVPSARPMVMDENPVCSAASLAASRFKVPVAERADAYRRVDRSWRDRQRAGTLQLSLVRHFKTIAIDRDGASAHAGIGQIMVHGGASVAAYPYAPAPVGRRLTSIPVALAPVNTISPCSMRQRCCLRYQLRYRSRASSPYAV